MSEPLLWNKDQAKHEELSAKIREIASIPDKLQRYQTALAWIEYCSAYPELASDYPIKYFAVLSAYVQDPSLLTRI